MARASDGNEQLLCSFCGKSQEEISRDMERDFFLSPVEAKDYGIIDTVITNREAIRNEDAA